jgi:hypothetical protein
MPCLQSRERRSIPESPHLVKVGQLLRGRAFAWQTAWQTGRAIRATVSNHISLRLDSPASRDTPPHSASQILRVSDSARYEVNVTVENRLPCGLAGVDVN